MREAHDPTPDGLTGPFMRKPHLRKMVNGVPVFDYDARCHACSQLSKVADAADAAVVEQATYEVIGLILPTDDGDAIMFTTEYEAEEADLHNPGGSGTGWI